MSFRLTSRRSAIASLLMPLALLISVPHAHAASLEEIQKRGYLVVATEDDFRPFEFVKDGKPTGFDNEMVEALKKYAKFEIRQEILPWTGILAGVATGKYDIAITAAIITKERAQSLDFTSPIADATHYYVKRKGDDSIKSIKDLNGKTEYTSYPEAYQDLALKRTDYVVNTVINLKSLVAEKGAVFELGQPVSGKSYPAWAIKKGNADLLAYMNKFIAEQKANGTMPALQKKWFGESFTLPVTFTPEF
jgi:polar amino acid transport system substrate-binding protein